MGLGLGSGARVRRVAAEAERREQREREEQEERRELDEVDVHGLAATSTLLRVLRPPWRGASVLRRHAEEHVKDVLVRVRVRVGGSVGVGIRVRVGVRFGVIGVTCAIEPEARGAASKEEKSSLGGAEPAECPG